MFFGWIPSPTKFPRDSCFSQPHHNKHMVAITLPLHNPPSCKEQMRTLKVPTAHVLLQKHLFFLVTWCNHQPPRVDGRVFVLGSELGFPKADWLTLVISHSYQLGNPIQVDIPSLWVCLFFFGAPISTGESSCSQIFRHHFLITINEEMIIVSQHIIRSYQIPSSKIH